MTRVVLLNLRYLVDIDFQAKDSLGLAYLAGTLIQDGHRVDVIDAQAKNLSTREVADLVLAGNYDVVGASLYQETMPSFAELLDRIGSRTDAHICCGGQYASFEAENIIEAHPRVDSVVIGEGELTFGELIRQLPAGDWQSVPGICFRRDGAAVHSEGRRSLIVSLDEMPAPYRDYFLGGPDQPPDVEATVAASRGCYAKCEFCSIQTFYRFQRGKKLRIRDPRKVVGELAELNAKYGVRRFFFADDDFMITEKISKGWVAEFVDEIHRRELEISFDLDCRVDDLSRETFKGLRDAGLRGVFLGIESFVQRPLDMMRKGVTVDDNIAGIELLRDLRITVWMGFIMFDPFTTPEELRENLKGFDRIHYFRYFNYDRPLSSDLVASRLTPYPGTPIVNTLKQLCPELLFRTRYGWDYEFGDSRTAQFWDHLLEWKKVSLEMIRRDTTFLIREANRMGDAGRAARLHALSRRYMRLDRDVFLQLLGVAESGAVGAAPVADIIAEGRARWSAIDSEIATVRAEMAHPGTRIELAAAGA